MKKTLLATAIAALVAGTAHAASTELILYRLQNFQGQSQVVNGEVNNLEGGFAKDVSSMVVKGGYWEVCNKDHFKGDCRVIAPGEYPQLDYVLDDRIISARYLGNDPKLQQRVVKMDRAQPGRGGAQVTVYKLQNFKGDSQVVKGEINSLEGGFARDASSLVVKGGYWEVCNQDHFKGDCRVLAEGEYPRLDYVLDDRIVSMRFLGTDPKYQQRVVKVERGEDRPAAPAVRDTRSDGNYTREGQYSREQYDNRNRTAPAERRMTGAIDLYSQPNFGGRSVHIDDSVADLAEKRYEGRASSAIVREGVWQLCTEPGYRGDCGIFRPGEYAELARLDDRVSSIRQVR